MPNIEAADAQAWAESTKLTITSLDAALEDQVSSQILGKLRARFEEEVDTWIDPSTTPTTVKSIIAMIYVSWFYARQFSGDGDMSEYSARLMDVAKHLLEGLLMGALTLLDDTGATPEEVLPNSQPTFYPDDLSSSLEPTSDDTSLGPAKFTMGSIW